jgi:hypothetical protein
LQLSGNLIERLGALILFDGSHPMLDSKMSLCYSPSDLWETQMEPEP